MDPIQLEIVYADGTTKNVSAIAVDLMHFEAHFDMSIAGLATPKLTHLFYLAYSVEKRTKATELEFEPWVETISIVKEGSDSKK
jgi:hypothetical protein